MFVRQHRIIVICPLVICMPINPEINGRGTSSGVSSIRFLAPTAANQAEGNMRECRGESQSRSNSAYCIDTLFRQVFSSL